MKSRLHSYAGRRTPSSPPSEESTVVEGKKYDIVYLVDMFSTKRGADAAVTARVRCAWKKFRELAPF